MKTVVSNTSPIRYLICIDEQDILPQLFGRVWIPTSVFQELTDQSAPAHVRTFMRVPPGWIEWQEVRCPAGHSLDHLDVGERDAIWLTEQIGADLLLIDEKKGRLTALERGLNVIGLLGILKLAAVRDNVDLPDAIEKLLHTNFKVSPSLIQHILHSIVS